MSPEARALAQGFGFEGHGLEAANPQAHGFDLGGEAPYLRLQVDAAKAGSLCLRILRQPEFLPREPEVCGARLRVVPRQDRIQRPQARLLVEALAVQAVDLRHPGLQVADVGQQPLAVATDDSLQREARLVGDGLKDGVDAHELEAQALAGQQLGLQTCDLASDHVEIVLDPAFLRVEVVGYLVEHLHNLGGFRELLLQPDMSRCTEYISASQIDP